MTRMVPALFIERVLAEWTFEDGGYVAIVSGGKLPATREIIAALEELLAIKKRELDSIDAKSASAPPMGVQ